MPVPRGYRSGSGMAHSPEKFWARVKKSAGCWIWLGATQIDGYGYVLDYSLYDSSGKRHCKWVNAHRVAWRLEHGPIADGLCVLHRCDNPPCVRPDHLFLGKKENSEDCVKKERLSDRYGANNPNCKLSVSDVARIRKLYREGEGSHTQQQLADLYHVSQNAISQIVRRLRW